MDKQLQDYLDFAKDLAQQAGKIQRRYFNAVDIGTVDKDNDTPVTVADLKINQLVIDSVKQAYSDHGILGEEGSFEPNREYVWVCDPIDGTFPFSHGIPVFTFSLALVHQGSSIVSVVYDTMSERMATAVLGSGAWINDDRLKLLAEYPASGMQGVEVEVWTSNDAALFDNTEIPFEIDKAMSEAGFMNLFFCSIVYPGMLCAAGQLVGFVFGGRNTWDVAAISLIISEAGGVVSDCFGERENLRYDSYVNGLIVARNESEYKKIADAVVPIFKAGKIRA